MRKIELSKVVEVLENHKPTGRIPASLQFECLDHVACSGCRWVSKWCTMVEAEEEHRNHVAKVILEVVSKEVDKADAIAGMQDALDSRFEDGSSILQYVLLKNPKLKSQLREHILGK